MRVWYNIQLFAKQKCCGEANVVGGDTMSASTCIIPPAKKAYVKEEDMTEQQSGQVVVI